MRYLYALLVVLLLSQSAFAKPHTLSWTWPTQDCDAESLIQSEWNRAEIIYDTEAMPMPSDAAGPCSGTPDPDGPPTATVVPLTNNQVSTTLNLQPGVTYYARIRVCYYFADNCSSWSNQTVFTVPYGKPQAITTLDGN